MLLVVCLCALLAPSYAVSTCQSVSTVPTGGVCKGVTFSAKVCNDGAIAAATGVVMANQLVSTALPNTLDACKAGLNITCLALRGTVAANPKLCDASVLCKNGGNCRTDADCPAGNTTANPYCCEYSKTLLAGSCDGLTSATVDAANQGCPTKDCSSLAYRLYPGMYPGVAMAMGLYILRRTSP